MSEVGAWLSNAWDYYFGDSTDPSVLAQERIRAYGVDPTTGGLISPVYGQAANSAGYNAGNPNGFIQSVTAQVNSQFNTDYARNYADLTASGTGIGAGSGQNLFTFGLIAVLVFFLIKAVK